MNDWNERVVLWERVSELKVLMYVAKTWILSSFGE